MNEIRPAMTGQEGESGALRLRKGASVSLNIGLNIVCPLLCSFAWVGIIVPDKYTQGDSIS